MSRVSNYVLKVAAGGRAEFVEELNRRLHERAPNGAGPQAFTDATDVAGGPRALEISIYLAALNYVEPEQLQSVLRAVLAENSRNHFPWGYCLGNVELFAQRPGAGYLVRIFPQSSAE